jgi:phage portal protein BeeE
VSILNWFGESKKQITELSSKVEALERQKKEMIQYLDRPYNYQFASYNNQSGHKYNSDVLLLMYENVSQINSLINYIANKAAEIPIKHFRYQGNGKKKWLGETEYQKFVDTLNIEDLILQFLIQGNVFIQKKQTPGFEAPTSATIQPSNVFYVIPLNRIDEYGTPSTVNDVFENPVIRYSKKIDSGVLKNYPIEEIIHVKDLQANRTGKDFYYGTSRIYAASASINVLKNIYETINTILGGKGALGFVSQKIVGNDGQLMAALNPDMMKEVERRLNEDFGTTNGKRAIMATAADASWNRMDSPISEFTPVELTAQEFRQLCNQIGGVPDILFNAVSNASYNNMSEAKAAMIENVISPILTKIFAEITKDLKLNLKNEWLEPDFSEIPAMQRNRKQDAEGLVAEANYLTTMLDKKLITKNVYLEKMGFPQNSDPTFDEIKPEPEPMEPDTDMEDTDENSEDNGNETV